MHVITSHYLIRFKSCLISFGILLLLSISFQNLAQTSLAVASNDSINKLTEKIEKTFPSVEGYVVSLQDKKVIVDLKVKDGIKKGMELHVISEGKEFMHPITGAVLGRFEESIGDIQIIEIKDTYSIATVVNLEKGKAIKEKDKVRISSTKIRIALIPIINLTNDANIDTSLLSETINQKLVESDRFEVIDKAEILSALLNLGIKEVDDLKNINRAGLEEKVKKIGKLLNARGILTLTLNKTENTFIVDTELYSTFTSLPLLKTSVVLEVESTNKSHKVSNSPEVVDIENISEDNKSIFSSVTPSIGQFILDKATEKSQRLDFSLVDLAIGDVNGDNENEVVVSAGKGIVIYKWKSNSLIKIWAEEENVGSHHLAVDVADINHNGIDEIFVTNLSTSSLNSYVLEFTDANFRRIIDDINIFFRVLTLPGEGIRLLGQKKGISQFFSGGVYRYMWDGHKYYPSLRLDIPKDTNIFGFALGDLNNDNKIETAVLDKYNRLKVYHSSEEDLDWKSSDHYGGSNLVVDFNPKSTIKFSDDSTRIKIDQRIYIQDIDNNGINEIILPKNISSTLNLLPNTPSYRRGKIVGLESDEVSYTEKWSTREVEAYIANLYIGDIDNDRLPELVIGINLVSGFTDFFKKEKSMILFYNL
ncbi:MAG: FG-GAP-like repeat-containing protein [bacterium]